MILSDPFAGILNEQNKNEGPNPYAMQAAGLLQQIQAQQAMQAKIYEDAAARNQAEANKSGMPMGQFSNGLKNLINKNNPSPSPSNKPLSWGTTPVPTQQPDTEIPPLNQSMPIPQQRFGMNDVGTMTPPAPSPSFSEMIPRLSSAAKSAYPDNPTMQQVAMTQAILESGLNGRPSQLATKYNNYFGIKSNRSFPGTGGTVDMPTQEYVGGSPTTMNQGFSSNNSMNDSFMQHAALMNGSSRYSPVLQAKSPGEAFSALGDSGYATDPNYADKLNSIFAQYVSPLYG